MDSGMDGYALLVLESKRWAQAGADEKAAQRKLAHSFDPNEPMTDDDHECEAAINKWIAWS